MIRTFELDDIPWNFDKCMTRLDDLKEHYPNFKCTVFAIPEEMTEQHWRELDKRRDWMEVGPHGFSHQKRECRNPTIYIPKLYILDEIAEDERWAMIYKSPWYGYDRWFLEALVERGFVICCKELFDFPYPIPSNWRMWNLRDQEYGRLTRGDGDLHQYKLIHPEFETNTAANFYRSGLTKRNVRRWTNPWNKEDDWIFVSQLSRPVCLKLNLGCGEQIWNGWTCLDPRAEDFGRGVVKWDFSRMIPYGSNKADVVFTSHVFEYVAEDKYTEALLDVWRVLRPDGVLRMSEARTDTGYVWRLPGDRARGTGTIRSLPTKEKIYSALAQVGFEIHNAVPGATISPHKDVLLGDGRNMRYEKEHKFYVEAVKKIRPRQTTSRRVTDVLDLRRPHQWDVRAPSDRAHRDFGRYHLPR